MKWMIPPDYGDTMGLEEVDVIYVATGLNRYAVHRSNRIFHISEV